MSLSLLPLLNYAYLKAVKMVPYLATIGALILRKSLQYLTGKAFEWLDAITCGGIIMLVEGKMLIGPTSFNHCLDNRQ